MRAAKREVRAPAGPIVEAIALEAIEPSPHNPRIFDAGRDQGLASLAESIRSQGVIQPVVVRPVAGDGGERYQLVAGERRWRASKLAGVPTIPAVIREDLSDEQALEVADRLGKPVRWVARRAQLVKLSPKWREVMEVA